MLHSVQQQLRQQSAARNTSRAPGIGFSPDKMLQGRLFSYGAWMLRSLLE